MWKLKLYPNGDGQYGGNGKMSVYLICTNPGRSQTVSANYEISILDKNKTKRHPIQGYQMFNHLTQSNNNQNNISRSQIDSSLLLSNDDTLTIVCEITEDGYHRSSLMTEGLQKNKKVDPMVPVMLDTSVYHKQLFKV